MKIYTTVSAWFHRLTRHYAIETPDHVGAFAGAYLERRDWDHA
jgi:hypothetical protein